jgi:hypothetical protein
MADLRTISPSFVALGPCGVAIRDRLKGLTAEDEKVLRLVGEHLDTLASKDLEGPLRGWSGPRRRQVGGAQA